MKIMGAIYSGLWTIALILGAINCVFGLDKLEGLFR